MKKQNSLLTCLLALLLVSAVGCAEKKSTKSSTDSSSTSTSPTTSTGTVIDTGNGSDNGNTDGNNDPDQGGISDGNQTNDYFTLANIKVHGRAHWSETYQYNAKNESYGTPNYYSNPSRDVVWSSQSGVGSSDQGIFMTNSRFNVRVVPRSIGSGERKQDWTGSDANGCYFTAPYQKLKLTLCVRKSGGSCINQYSFEASVDSASNVKEFSFPDTSEPLIVEVLDAESDFNCNQGNSSYCPYGGHNHTACMKFDIQFSTDSTKDLPGNRY